MTLPDTANGGEMCYLFDMFPGTADSAPGLVICRHVQELAVWLLIYVLCTYFRSLLWKQLILRVFLFTVPCRVNWRPCLPNLPKFTLPLGAKTNSLLVLSILFWHKTDSLLVLLFWSKANSLLVLQFRSKANSLLVLQLQVITNSLLVLSRLFDTNSLLVENHR